MEEIKKYMTNETINEVIEKFETAMDTGLIAILPVIISGGILLILSIIIGVVSSSVILGILFFVCSSPLFILAVGTYSIGNALKRLIDSINFLIQTTVNISIAVYKDNKELGNSSVKVIDISKYSFNNILLPVLKTAAKRKPFGKILLKVIESVLKRRIKPISNIIENEVNAEGIQTIEPKGLSKKGLGMINDISKMAIKSIVTISIFISAVFALIGITLTTIIFIVYFYILINYNI